MKMKKCLTILILMVMLVPLAFAQVCGDIVKQNANCTVISPVLTCTPDYSVYSTNGSLLENGTMSVLNSSANIYYFQWGLNESGVIEVCDYTREIQVGGGDMSDLLAIMFAILGFIWVLIAVSKLLKEEHTLLKLLFTISAVILGVGGLGYAVQIASENGSALVLSATTTLFKTATIIQYLFFGYLLFYYVYKVLMYMHTNIIKK